MIRKGIDVSVWQGDIDFYKVKKSGIDFVIIRAGYGNGNKDKWFEENYRKAKAAGLDAGAYWYSYAASVSDAFDEALSAAKVLKGKTFEYPIYFDIEEQKQISKGQDFCSSLISTFCSKMETLGYFAGFYTSLSAAMHAVSPAVRKRYAFWIAQWNDRCTYDGTYGLWQYSSKGSVEGISGRVDMDYAYIDYPSIIKKSGLNGYMKGSATMARTADAFVLAMESWNGYSEANGKFKTIIDLYNSHKPLARGYAVKYSDEWCDTCVSAAAIKAGMVDLIGTECGCERHVDIFKKKGIWIEDGSIVPRRGDIIMYNWDQGYQPNNGGSDHIGVVVSVSGGTITVIEGNKSEAVGYRKIPVGWGYIRGYARPRYESGDSISAPEKTVDELAREVLQGKWGNGDERAVRLKNAGYSYDAVQKRVNELLSSGKSLDELAKEVINGKWGNGQDRVNRLKAAGYDYNAVQSKVNAILSGNKKSIDTVAREVIRGNWGNGQERKRRLTKAGYDYARVQKRVNELL